MVQNKTISRLHQWPQSAIVSDNNCGDDDDDYKLRRCFNALSDYLFIPFFFFILWPTRLIMSRVVSAAMASMCFPGKMLQIPLGFFTLLIKHKHIMILETFISPKCWTLLKTQLRQRLTICSRCSCCCSSSSSCHKRIDNLNFLSVCTHYALSRRV